MGWPGSVNDVTILKNSRLWKNRATLFEGDQYLFADRGKSYVHQHTLFDSYLLYRLPIITIYSPAIY
jgi:hypothetical protein